MNVYAKLQAARMKLHAMELKKSGHNKFAGYKYFELADFVVPALEIFDELKLCGVVSFGKEVATLTIVDLETGSKVEITSPMSSAALKGCHEVQNLGAVETYIRRYLWVAALEIVEHDALDSSEPVKEESKIDRAKVDEYLTNIKSAKNPDALKKIYTEAYGYAKEDKTSCDRIIAAKDTRKSELAIELQGQA
jgi:hypothetical protein